MTLRQASFFALFVCFCAAVWSVSTVLVPFFAGCIGAYALSPLVLKLEKWHVSRVFGTILAMLIFFALVGGLLMIIVPYAHRELVVISANIPLLSQKILLHVTPLLDFVSKELGTPSVAAIKTELSNHVGQIAQVILSFLVSVVGSGMAIANIISILILTPVVLFYFLKDWEIFLHNVHRLIPVSYRSTALRYIQAMDTTLGGYARGQAIVCLIQMVFYSFGLWLIKVPDAFFIGFITGFLTFIPYLGGFVGLTLSFIVIMIDFQGPWQVGALLAVFILIQLFEGNVLTPRFIGKKVGLHPIWIIFSLLAGANWFGFMGVVLALPVAAILSAITRLWIQDYYASVFYQRKNHDASTPSSPSL